MTVLKVFTNTVDLTTVGGGFSTSGTFADLTRVNGSFQIGSNASASVEHAQSSGTTTWYHFIMGVDYANTTQFLTDVFLVQERGVDGGSTIASLLMTNGRPQFRVVGDTTESTNTLNLTNATRYAVDISVTVTSTLITVSGYINNLLIGTVTADNTTQNKQKPGRCVMTNLDNFGSTYFSECIIADEDTRGWRLRELRPQSFGVDQAWTGTVNDVVDQDLSTGISTATNGARTNFGLSKLENVTGGDIVNRVVAQTYAQRGATGLTRINHYFRYPDQSREDGGDITVTTTGTWYLTEFTTNPKTSQPWVPADLTGIQMGLRAQT